MTSTALTAYEPRDIGELRQFAQEVTATALVPTAYRGKPADAMVAMMYGKETAGLGPLTSLQYVAVINGRPAFYSDALPGIAFNKGLITDMAEEFEGTPYEDAFKAICRVWRPNGREVRQEFSVADAKKAGLWGKSGPWQQYPKRMLQWRARGWAIRDAAPHALFGMTAEELRDIEEHRGPEHAKEINPREAGAAKPAQPLEPPQLVELYTADGEEFLLEPGQVEQWIKDQIAGATDEDLKALFENNPEAPRLRSAIQAAWDARDEAQAQQEQAQAQQQAPQAQQPQEGAPAGQPKRTAKEVAEAIAARFEAARNMDELLAAEGEIRDDMARLPLAAKEKLARIFHRRREALEQPAEPPDERQPELLAGER